MHYTSHGYYPSILHSSFFLPHVITSMLIATYYSTFPLYLKLYAVEERDQIPKSLGHVDVISHCSPFNYLLNNLTWEFCN